MAHQCGCQGNSQKVEGKSELVTKICLATEDMLGDGRHATEKPLANFVVASSELKPIQMMPPFFETRNEDMIVAAIDRVKSSRTLPPFFETKRREMI